MLKAEFNKIFDSGIRNKKEIYNILEKKTGIKRSTIRRNARDYLRELRIKVIILSKHTPKHTKTTSKALGFIPKDVRWHWEKFVKKDFVIVKCAICRARIGYVIQYYDGNLICNICQGKFPEVIIVEK